MDVRLPRHDNHGMTSEADRAVLLSVARNAISGKLQGRRPDPDGYLPPGAERPKGTGGVFVTLKIRGNLRGCIGRIRSEDPIVETVSEMARAAAFEDPRFPPVSSEEFPELTIEISRLSPFFPIAADDVKVGVHGLMLRLGYRSGLLLPQVPGEQGWDRSAFLSGLCRKSGLPDGAWADPDARLEAFTAEVFGED